MKEVSKMEMKYEFRPVKGHVEVYLNGVFQFSADTISEAESMIGGAESE